MIVAIILAVGASLLFAPWRVSTGLLLGGLLSLVNHYWLITSTTAAFSVLVNGEKPRLGLIQYVLRYAVIGSVILLVYTFGLASIRRLSPDFAVLCSPFLSRRLENSISQLFTERKSFDVVGNGGCRRGTRCGIG